MTTIVNGGKVTNPHRLVELGSKTYLVEVSEWKGEKRLTIILLWEPKDSPGQLMRAKNPLIIPIEDDFNSLLVLFDEIGSVIHEAFGVSVSDLVIEAEVPNASS